MLRFSNVELYIAQMKSIHAAWDNGQLTGDQAVILLNAAYRKYIRKSEGNAVSSILNKGRQ